MGWILVENTATRKEWKNGNATVTMDISPKPGPWYKYLVAGNWSGAGFKPATSYHEAMRIANGFMQDYLNNPKEAR